MNRLIQIPGPGASVLLHKGDLLEFTLSLERPVAGTGWLRTNLGDMATRQRQIIERAELGKPYLACDWHDIPMRRVDDRHFSIRLPLLDVGYYEAKTFLLTDDTGDPLWPQGRNVSIKVEPAVTVGANSIYNAFVRQFGPDKSQAPSSRPELARATGTLDTAGYTVIPKSGKFRDLIAELDFIMGTLRFRYIQLLPVFPTPTTYARMGRFGSPFASLDLMDVDPAMAEFDKRATPMDQFIELVDAIHTRSGSVLIDIPINHTGWASRLQRMHPEWFSRAADGTFESPGAWGVKWEDLVKLDYHLREVWHYMAEVFLFWCRRGVDGFRCDAGYMIPVPVWEYIVAKVRREFPDTIFLLEGLGGDLRVVEELLTTSNLNWAYSELFQNYDQGQLEWYLPTCDHTSAVKGTLVHFAETHDNNRLASTSKAYARMRTLLSALLSHNGAFGITSGVEWFCDQKIDVHESRSMNWGAHENMVDVVGRLNAILELLPAFHAGATLRMIQADHQNMLAVLRRHPAEGHPVLVLANLNVDKAISATWKTQEFLPASARMYDLVTGREVAVESGTLTAGVTLSPADVICLTHEASDLTALERLLAIRCEPADCNREKSLQAKALEVWRFFHGNNDASAVDVRAASAQLAADPRRYCADMAAAVRADALPGRPHHVPVVRWIWPQDVGRIVMIPPENFLLIIAHDKFAAELRDGDRVIFHEQSLERKDGSNFVLFMPVVSADEIRRLSLVLTVLESGAPRKATGKLLYLPTAEHAWVQKRFEAGPTLDHDLYALCTNGRGGFSQVRGAWGEIRSKYDAFLAGNLHPEMPVDRHVVFTRLRGWVVYRGYSHELNREGLKAFGMTPDGVVVWNFEVPAGDGKFTTLDISLRLVTGQNTAVLDFARGRSQGRIDRADDALPIRVILRPDVEDRNGHDVTRAYAGPERSFPGAVSAQGRNGFVFAPVTDRRLVMSALQGTFDIEPQWNYMVSTPLDAERGLDASTDLYSPGYFTLTLNGGETARLQADILIDPSATPAASGLPVCVPSDYVAAQPLKDAMQSAMGAFIVKRESLKTVIAGYPWFLDWGRDTLICLRGMIAAGLLDDSREILKQFARFELDGTIPNMIRGGDVSNRDTSDAPLWFFVACADLIAASDDRFLNEDVGGRTLRQVLGSLAAGIRRGTPNGIRMDEASGLVFSPSHFTWMDTNYPAATPRMGYPIEIQALWFAALSLMARLDRERDWSLLAAQVKTSIVALYTVTGLGYLSDCLHAVPGEPAARAIADDALRPNQLLAVTLGAVTESPLVDSLLASCEGLLIPGGIRSLSDGPVSPLLAVRHDGLLVNDSAHPYWGSYSGDEDTRRKPAYHNGTAWTWQFPLYAEALHTVYGSSASACAKALLGSSVYNINRGCIGQVPEIIDGDNPHALRGCGAQAWGVTELYRVLAILDRQN